MTSVPRFWRTLDFFGCSVSIKQMRILGSFVKNCVKWSQYQLEEARIDAYSHLPTLLDLARSCKHLKLLRIGTRSNLQVEGMLQIMTLCSSLESFHIPMPPKVDYLFRSPTPLAAEKRFFMGIPPTGRLHFTNISGSRNVKSGHAFCILPYLVSVEIRLHH